MVATVWLRPSGLPAGTPFHDKAATFWGNQSQFEHYLSVRDRDALLLKSSLGGHPNATVILYFEAYLADAAVWGEAPVQRLGSAVTHFVDLEARLDAAVGRSVAMAVERGGARVELSLAVQDLHAPSVTPDVMLECAGGIVHALSYLSLIHI